MTNVTLRRATADDANALFEIRRRSIIVLAPPVLSAAEAHGWAAALTIDGMAKKLDQLELWLAQTEGAVAGWGAIRDDRLEGLDTAPEFANLGIGTRLLQMLKDIMHRRGIRAVHADASVNAEAFYLRRGYLRADFPLANGALPIRKQLSAIMSVADSD